MGRSGIEYPLSGMKWDIFILLMRVMLIGQHIHTLDPKKRISLPSQFRKELGKKLVLTNGLDRCIFVYGLEEWTHVAEKLGNTSIGSTDQRGFNRFILAGASEVEVDASGRILIPEFLKKFANLGERVVLAGVHNRVEIWDEEAWNMYQAKLTGEADVLAEKLSEVGII